MLLKDLQLSHIYKLPVWGYCIYRGVKHDTELLVFTRIEDEDKETEYYLASEFAHTIRMPLDHIKKLQAAWLHNDKRQMIKKGDYLFFEGNHGIHVGKVKSIHKNICELTVKNITREVPIRHLFTYETTFGNMQKRASTIAIMQGENSPDTKREVPESVAY